MNLDKKLLDMLQNQVVGRGINDPRILEAMQRAPRHFFVPSEEQTNAYEDHPIALPEDRATISQPYMVAYMTQALECRSSDSIMEIGTGSGYQAAVLSCLCHKVFTVERHQSLSLNAQRTLQTLGRTNVYFRVGDGLEGWPENSPYDKIIVTAAARKPPRVLAEQLKEGGSMIIPLGDSQIQTLTRVKRQGDRYVAHPLIPCVFVPLVTKTMNLTETDGFDWVETVHR